MRDLPSVSDRRHGFVIVMTPMAAPALDIRSNLQRTDPAAVLEKCDSTRLAQVGRARECALEADARRQPVPRLTVCLTEAGGSTPGAGVGMPVQPAWATGPAP